MPSDEGYRRAKEQIAQLEAEISEFKESSRELEAELELELEESERKHKELQGTVERLTREVADWKTKYLESQKSHAASQISLQKQITSLQEAHKAANNRLREIEMENDDMERHERITKSSLNELEQKYHDSLEEIAMLEADLSGKDDLKVDLQRSKDELRDVQEELMISNNKISQQEALIKRYEEEIAEQKVKIEKLNATSSSIARTPSIYLHRPRVSSGSSAIYVPPTQAQLTSSKSLRKIHGMLDQMRNLESRVANFKSSLPRSSTPTGSPHGLVRSTSDSSTNSNSNSNSPSTSIPIWTSSRSPDTTAVDTTNIAGSLPLSSTPTKTSSSFLRRREVSKSFYGSPLIEEYSPIVEKDEEVLTPKTLYYNAPSVRGLETIKGSPSEFGVKSEFGGKSLLSSSGDTKHHTHNSKFSQSVDLTRSMSRSGRVRRDSEVGGSGGSSGSSNVGSRSGSRTGSRTGSRSDSRSDSRSHSRSDNRSDSRTGTRSGSRTGTRSDSRIINKTPSRDSKTSTHNHLDSFDTLNPSPTRKRIDLTLNSPEKPHRPGSAFSALRPKTSIGHGRFV